MAANVDIVPQVNECIGNTEAGMANFSCRASSDLGKLFFLLYITFYFVFEGQLLLETFPQTCSHISTQVCDTHSCFHWETVQSFMMVNLETICANRIVSKEIEIECDKTGIFSLIMFIPIQHIVDVFTVLKTVTPEAGLCVLSCCWVEVTKANSVSQCRPLQQLEGNIELSFA